MIHMCELYNKYKLVNIKHFYKINIKLIKCYIIDEGIGV